MGWGSAQRRWIVLGCVLAACGDSGQDVVGTRYAVPNARSAAGDPGAGGADGFGNATVAGSAGHATGLPPPAADAGWPSGSVKPRAALDPNVRFDWEETSRGGSSCMAGVYSGTFACQFKPNAMMPGFDFGTYDVSGPISLTLKQSMNGEFLEIANGVLDALAQEAFGMHARLEGRLDCATKKLGAQAKDGVWALGDPTMPILPGGDFGATLDATFDAQKLELDGTWTIDSGTVPGTCTGTWTAVHTGTSANPNPPGASGAGTGGAPAEKGGISGASASMAGTAGTGLGAAPQVSALDANAVLRASCAKSSVQSQLLPANILFVLDRSASMLCNPPPATDSASCESEPARANPNLASKWEITSKALLDALSSLPATASVGLSYFSIDDACGVNSTPNVPIAPNTQAQRDAIANDMKQVSPGGGTPIAGAMILAYKHLHEAALAGRIYGNEFVVLITDGAQSELCSDPMRCIDAASCTDLLVGTEVPKAAGPGVGIRSFVIGVPGSEPARRMLSQIAQQGGTAAPGCDPERGDCHFDMSMVSDLGGALANALTQISGRAVSCELDLPQPSDVKLDLGLVNVVYTPSRGGSAAVLRQDASAACESGANGWQYNADNTKIRLCGATCDAVRGDAQARVDVVLGCPVQGVQ